MARFVCWLLVGAMLGFAVAGLIGLEPGFWASFVTTSFACYFAVGLGTKRKSADQDPDTEEG